jgi:GNAT superfamily N-acetyltransferase
MSSVSNESSDLEFHPVSADRWLDLVSFFSTHGNPNYCWCQRWRLRSAEYRRLKSSERKGKLASLVQGGQPVGILAYQGETPVGWCSVAPRESYALLEHSTTLKRIDDQPVWSVVCFFVASNLRQRGLTVELLSAAVGYALSRGARTIEGYPVELDQGYRFMGSPSVFELAGFQKAAVARNGRAIVRYTANGGT